MRRFHEAACAALAVAVLASPASADDVHKIGAVTRHPAPYVGRQVTMVGYRLAVGDGYVLVSDEASGRISSHDLPVTGPDIDTMKARTKYLLHGRFLKGRTFANGSVYHLELSDAPQPVHGAH